VAVEFRILGDVEARSQGRRLDIGHARQRCVLACLLVDVNRPVSADQLIDRVWADNPPHRARNALAAYISRLRQLLGGEDDVQIVREPGGYMLSTDAQSVDLHLFRELASRARAAADPVDAAAHFDRALELWRGEALATLDTPWTNAVRTSLEVERLSATLDRNDAALESGCHADVLGELAATALAHPLDERVAGQLMLAQSRSGRQADALETYRRVRNRLVDELGIDPGAKLRQVHEQILAGDDDQPIDVPPAPVVDHHVVPDLPRRATSLIGRERDLQTVTAALAEGPLVTLTGVGGVGKTRLALEVAQGNNDNFSDGAVFCELAPLDSGAALGHIVAAVLRLKEKPGLGIDGTVVEYLRAHELLLVLDNCEHVLDAAASLVEQIVAECHGVSVLATSREMLGVQGERIVPVPPLEDADAATLFAERARAGRPDFDLDREPVGAVAEICRRLDGVPLAIELAAARMRAMSSLDVARRLDGLRLLRGGARGAHPRQQSVAATIDWSYRLLAKREQALFAQLSVFAGGFDLEAVHGVCAPEGAAEEDTLELLAGLVDKSMVIVRDSSGMTRYGVLETLRAYGRERLREGGIEDLYANRHAVYYTELTERAACGMHGPDEVVWVERLLLDYDNLRAAFEHTLGCGNVDLALRLVTSVPYLAHLRTGYEYAVWAARTVEVANADHPLFPAAVGVAARAAWNRREFSRVRSLADLVGGRVPRRGIGRVEYPADVLADVILNEGDAHSALAHYEAEVERARRDGDPIRLVWTLFYLPVCHAVLRNPEAGLPAAHEAVQVADATGNPSARSMAYYSLGLVLKKSEPDRALALFDQAAELAASVQNLSWYGIALMESAATHAVHGDPAAAARMFIDVLEHWDRVGDWNQQWLNLRYVTRLLVRLGANEDAVALHHALLAAGKPSPLTAEHVSSAPGQDGSGLAGAQAVARALSALQSASKSV
jgi:predicted ATPase/DNA-binding SARP family transcriptional activator